MKYRWHCCWTWRSFSIFGWDWYRWEDGSWQLMFFVTFFRFWVDAAHE